MSNIPYKYVQLPPSFWLDHYPQNWPFPIYCTAGTGDDELKGFQEFPAPGGHHVGAYGYKLYRREVDEEALKKDLDCLDKARELLKNPAVLRMNIQSHLPDYDLVKRSETQRLEDRVTAAQAVIANHHRALNEVSRALKGSLSYERRKLKALKIIETSLQADTWLFEQDIKFLRVVDKVISEEQLKELADLKARLLIADGLWIVLRNGKVVSHTAGKGGQRFYVCTNEQEARALAASWNAEHYDGQPVCVAGKLIKLS